MSTTMIPTRVVRAHRQRHLSLGCYAMPACQSQPSIGLGTIVGPTERPSTAVAALFQAGSGGLTRKRQVLMKLEHLRLHGDDTTQHAVTAASVQELVQRHGTRAQTNRRKMRQVLTLAAIDRKLGPLHDIRRHSNLRVAATDLQNHEACETFEYALWQSNRCHAWTFKNVDGTR